MVINIEPFPSKLSTVYVAKARLMKWVRIQLFCDTWHLIVLSFFFFFLNRSSLFSDVKLVTQTQLFGDVNSMTQPPEYRTGEPCEYDFHGFFLFFLK